MDKLLTTYKELNDKYWLYCDRARSCTLVYGRNHIITRFWVLLGKRVYRKLQAIDKSIGTHSRPIGNYKSSFDAK